MQEKHENHRFEKHVLESLDDIRARLRWVDHKINHLLQHAHDAPPAPVPTKNWVTDAELQAIADSAKAKAVGVEAVAKKASDLSK